MKEINNNIEEPVCSLKVSQLLKEKGFNVPTSQFYKNDGLIDPKRFIGLFYKNSDFAENTFIAAPTHSVAVEWIRVNFWVDITANGVRYAGDDKASYYSVNVNGNSVLYTERFDTPQEAIEAALLYTLTNLIL